MKELSISSWTQSNLRRIEGVQQDIVDRMNVWGLKRQGYELDTNIEPLNVPFGCALSLVTFLEFCFFRSIFEMITGKNYS